MRLTELLEEWTSIHEQHVGMTMPRQPASDEELAALEAAYGHPFPDELKQLLQFTNGIDHNWTNNGYGYYYFPGVSFQTLTTDQVGALSGIEATLLESAVLETRHKIPEGDPDHTVIGSSAQLFSDAGGDPYGLVLAGWAKGGIWKFVGGDYPPWKARNLTEFVEDCIEFENQGLLQWSQYEPNSGCEVVRDWGGYGDFPRSLSRPAKIVFGSV